MPKLARWEVFPVDYPVLGNFRFLAPGSTAVRRTVVVKLTDEDGRVGWGQSVPSEKWSYETLESVASSLTNYIGPALLGQELGEWPWIEQTLDRIIGPGFSRGQPIAKAAVNLAWTDWFLRRQGQSVAEWCGRKTRHSIQLSWTIDACNVEQLGDELQTGLRRGYRSFNIKLTAIPELDLALCREARRTVPDGFLWVDANGIYQIDEALWLARQLADLGIVAWEQPFPANRISWYQRLKHVGALPILLDEPIITEVDLEEFYRLSMLDGITIKISRCGGITTARKVLERATQYELFVLASGLTDPDLSFAATLLLLGAFDYALPAALNGPQFLSGTILSREISVSADMAQVPLGLGLAVDVDEERVRSGCAV